MTDATPLLEVRDLTVTYGGVAAVDGVDMAVAAGEVVGLIGPNGAGKTSCIDAVGGFVRPRRGQVALDGRDIGGLPPHQRVAAGLARTFQSCELFPDLSVRDNLAVAAHRPSRWATLLDAVAPRRSPAASRAAELLDMFELGDVADALPRHLPHGLQRLVDLARALATEPRVVLLDEPAAGLDSDETAALGAQLRRLPELGVAALLVDHDMGLVMGSCSRVLVLDLGRMIASGPPAEIQADPAVVRAYLGETAAPAETAAPGETAAPA